ncbi:MAG: cytochrome b [Rhodocyclaceae bacterium]|nr:cytochrome b [Rhodocyclaceae bacterium]
MVKPIAADLSRDGDPPRHPALSIALHWISALAIVAAFVLVLGRELFDEKAVRAMLLTGHRSAGLLVLVITAARLVTRHRREVTQATESGFERLVAGAVHTVLYLMMIALPLLGWALSSARGHVVSLFGMIDLPALVARNVDLADQLGDIHETLAWTLLGFACVHAAAALWHHFVRGDAILRAMSPFRVRIRRA